MRRLARVRTLRLGLGRALVRRPAPVAAGVALIAHAAVVAATPGYRPRHDDHDYARIAALLLRTGHYPLHRVAGGVLEPSAYRPPGWPGLLAAIWALAGPSLLAGRLLVAVLAAFAAFAAAIVAGELWGGREALVAGLLVALSPLQLMLGATLESETLFTALLLGAVAAVLAGRRTGRRRWLAFGAVLLGGACITRTNGLVLVPVVAALAGSAATPLPVRLRHGALVAVAALAVVAPWTARNALELHGFVPVSTELGNTLAGTYNPVAQARQGRWLEPRRIGAYAGLYHRLRGGPPLDAALVTAVGAWVAAHPLYPLRVAGWNAQRLLGVHGPDWARFSLFTMSLGPAAAVAVWLGGLLVLLLGAVGIATVGRAAPRALVLLVAALLAPVLLIGAELRLAAPAEAVLAVFGAVPLSRLSSWVCPGPSADQPLS